jgi:ubiquinone/menaquinone biosynthesis C-methylase UbiE
MVKKYEYLAPNAETYKELGIKSTSYEMAFSQVEKMLGDVHGQCLLDFGCGAGRSAKFLETLGAERVIGVDHNQSMIAEATTCAGDALEFHLIKDRLPLANESMDGALAMASFVETKTLSDMKKCLKEIARVVKGDGIFVLATTNPKAFGHDFKSFTIAGNPGNLKSGDIVQCTIKGKHPFAIEDVYWAEEDYVRTLESAGFAVEQVAFPMVEADDDWLDEKKVAPTMVIKTKKFKGRF